MAEARTKLAFTTAAHSGAVNDCLGPITVQTQNASNVATNVNRDRGQPRERRDGRFFSDDTCGTAITSQTIAYRQATRRPSTTRPTARGDGTHLLTASATGLTSATQTQTVNQGRSGHHLG